MTQNCIYANFVGDGLNDNNIFDLSSVGNRDGCYEPYFLLKRILMSQGIEINTSDINAGKKILFELHMDVQSNVRNHLPKYVILNESPQIRPSNQQKKLLAKYSRIFTWRDDFVDNQRYFKINLPNKIVPNKTRGWHGRDRLSCMIASNKTVPYSSPLLIYSQRVLTIRWFEQHAPQDFDLFGWGWDGPPARHGLLGRVVGKLQRFSPRQSGKVFFPSYQGKVVSKLDTMQKYCFNICYENVRDLPGYITEKIFDSFFAGCIPIYWGASNISNYVPEDCFIDRRSFDSHEALYKFMVSMKEQEFIGYQERIVEFLKSDQAKPFSAEAFTETIVKTIVADLADAL